MSRKQPAEHFAKMIRQTMETPAWRGLSSTAQALYPWIKLQWKGTKNNNNGKIQFSNRQAAICLGVTVDTAGRGFHDLQRKGFLLVTKAARLGIGGQAQSPCYELTEIALPQSEIGKPRKLYLEWQAGHDFPIHKAMANNPSGKNGRAKTQSEVVHFDNIRQLEA